MPCGFSVSEPPPLHSSASSSLDETNRLWKMQLVLKYGAESVRQSIVAALAEELTGRATQMTPKL